MFSYYALNYAGTFDRGLLGTINSPELCSNSSKGDFNHMLWPEMELLMERKYISYVNSTCSAALLKNKSYSRMRPHSASM